MGIIYRWVYSSSRQAILINSFDRSRDAFTLYRGENSFQLKVTSGKSNKQILINIRKLVSFSLTLKIVKIGVGAKIYCSWPHGISFGGRTSKLVGKWLSKSILKKFAKKFEKYLFCVKEFYSCMSRERVVQSG